MNTIKLHPLRKNQAGLWFLGQAGYIIRSCNRTIVIDPYLSDSVGKKDPDYARAYPVPLEPEELEADILIVTHDHLDHLDPDTITAYKHKKKTLFVAPRLACRKLIKLGINVENIARIDSGETRIVKDVKITGVYAIPNEASVIDTAGYRIEFANGRSVYHSSDTGFSTLLLSAIPSAEVLLVCINGKFGNLNVQEAVRVTGAVKPTVAIPNHYDVMKKNAADPKKFAAAMKKTHPRIRVEIMPVLKPFIW